MFLRGKTSPQGTSLNQGASWVENRIFGALYVQIMAIPERFNPPFSQSRNRALRVHLKNFVLIYFEKSWSGAFRYMRHGGLEYIFYHGNARTPYIIKKHDL
jgi:hypothetical protein